MNILLTGVTGFVGGALYKKASLINKINIKSVVRQKNICDESVFIIDDIGLETNFAPALENIDIVIHCAGLAHITNELDLNCLAEYRRVNVGGTLNLANQAANAGVKRFIFISSIGVNGDISCKPFTAQDNAKPMSASAYAKWEAEQGLWKVKDSKAMEVVIIRSPLVYGRNAPGNLGKLAKFAEKSFPLPFGAIRNKRSLVSLDNLVDLIITCIHHPNAVNQTFLVSDDNDVSTTELLREMTLAAGKKPRLFPVPTSWLLLAGKLTGKQAFIDKLCGSLQVDISHTKDALGWNPPVSFKDGIRKCFDKG